MTFTPISSCLPKSTHSWGGSSRGDIVPANKPYYAHNRAKPRNTKTALYHRIIYIGFSPHLLMQALTLANSHQQLAFLTSSPNIAHATPSHSIQPQSPALPSIDQPAPEQSHVRRQDSPSCCRTCTYPPPLIPWPWATLSL